MSTPAHVLDIPTAEVFLPLLEAARYKGAYGGRASGKSHFMAEGLVDDTLEDANLRSVCIRETQLSLQHSAKQLIEDKINALNVGHYFRVLNTHVERRRGSGIIIFKGMQHFNAENIKSLEGFKRAWVEEAQTLSQVSLNLLRPTIRDPGSQLWFSWNPRYKIDPIDQLFRGHHPPSDSILVNANWRDNPWFSEELKQEMEEDFIRDPDMAKHVWEGDYLTEHKHQLISYLWIQEARGRKFVHDGSATRLRVSVDVADGGVDSSVATVCREHGAFDHFLKQESFNFPSGKAALMLANAAEAAFNNFDGRKAEDDFVVDGMGVGSGVVSILLARGYRVIRFAGGAESDNKLKYRNRRVQSYFAARNRLRDGKIIIDPNFIEHPKDWDEFVDQMCMVRRRPGLEKVEDLETKEQLVDREGVSPDRADSWAMRYATMLPEEPFGNIEVHAVSGVGETFDGGLT